MAVENLVARFRGITPQRVARSLRFRTMRVLGRFEPIRALSTTGASALGSAARSNAFPDVHPPEVVSGIRQNGYGMGLTLAPSMLEEIRAWAGATPCYGNQNPKWGFLPKDRHAAEKAANAKFTVAYYFNTLRCPAIATLRDDPVLAAIARRYMGPKAHVIATHLWWSFAQERADEEGKNTFAQMFHYDLDDYRFLKVFFYLTDVDMESGPHVYVRSSHKGKSIKQLFPLRRFGDDEVEGWYGKDRVESICAPAGTGFVVDTFGIHKGAAPTRRDRLLLQFEFQQRAYGFEADDYKDEQLSRIV